MVGPVLSDVLSAVFSDVVGGTLLDEIGAMLKDVVAEMLADVVVSFLVDVMTHIFIYGWHNRYKCIAMHGSCCYSRGYVRYKCHLLKASKTVL